MASHLGVCRNSGIRHDALLDWTHIRPPSEAQELLLSGRGWYAEESEGVFHLVMRVGRYVHRPLQVVALTMVRDGATGYLDGLLKR
ncbi:unnamed protein product [Pylaiella littoralis]